MSRFVYTFVKSAPRSLQSFRSSMIAPSFVSSFRAFSTEETKKENDSNEAITMTDACAERVQKIVKKKNLPLDQLHLRIAVQSGGCSGLQYKFTMDYDKVYEYDKEFIHPSGARLAVDSVSYDYIKGSVVDFEESLVRTGFVVTKNPNAAESCSCGTSFTAKAANPYE